MRTIKDLYNPFQPTHHFDDGISYTELKPCEPLSNYVHCYWQLKTQQPLHKDFTYQVITDGCMDIFWERNSCHENYVTGFANQYTEFSLEKEFNYLGIRFLPTAFPILFQMDASELTNKFEALQVVVPKLSKQLSEQSENITSLTELKNKMDVLLLQYITHADMALDTRLYAAVDQILQSQGTLSIEKDLNVGVSARQLRRLFHFYIGDSPKGFSKVVRFQSLLKGKPSVKSLQHNKLYYDLGYYDQAHFIKEFKHLYGATPNQALK